MLKRLISNIANWYPNIVNYVTMKRKSIKHEGNLELHGRVGFHGGGTLFLAKM